MRNANAWLKFRQHFPKKIIEVMRYPTTRREPKAETKHVRFIRAISLETHSLLSEVSRNSLFSITSRKRTADTNVNKKRSKLPCNCHTRQVWICNTNLFMRLNRCHGACLVQRTIVFCNYSCSKINSFIVDVKARLYVTPRSHFFKILLLHSFNFQIILDRISS